MKTGNDVLVLVIGAVIITLAWAGAYYVAGRIWKDDKQVVIETQEPTATAIVATATATSTPLPTPQLSHGPGTLVGKTPTIGYVLICTDGVLTWQQLSLVVHPNWPPSEVCE